MLLEIAFKPFLNHCLTIFAAPGKQKHRKIQCVFLSFSHIKTTSCHMVKTAYINTSVFARRWPKDIVNTVIFATSGKNIVNTVVMGFRSAKNIGIYRVFCSGSVKKMRKHHLFDDF